MCVSESGGAFSKHHVDTEDMMSEDDTDTADTDSVVEMDTDDNHRYETVVQPKRRLSHGPLKSLWSSLVLCVTKWFFQTNDKVNQSLTQQIFKADENVDFVNNADELALKLMKCFSTFESQFSPRSSDKENTTLFHSFVSNQKRLFRKLVIPSGKEEDSNFGAYLGDCSSPP